VSQNSEDSRARAAPERQARNTTSRRKDKPPKWLSGLELLQWKKFTDWRSAFQHEESHIRKTILFYTLHSSGVAIGISLIIAALIWKTMGVLYFTPSTLTYVANICCVTAASVTAIILAFILFLFGRAGELEDQARNSIRHEIRNLESIRQRIGDFVHGEVKESVTDASIKAKTKHLIDTAKKFDAAMSELIALFSRAARGTFYDCGKLGLLDSHILVRGGEWYAAYSQVFLSFEGRRSAVGAWEDANTATMNIVKLNSDVELAEGQHHRALQVSLALPSLLIIVVLALIAIFVANTLVIHESTTEFFIISLSVTLILLLATQIFLLVRWACQLVCREVIIRAANRETDRKYSERLAKVDEKEMLQDTLSLYTEYSKASTKAKERENDKPNGEI